MAYEKTVWQTGDIVTSEKLNKIENGIAASGGTLYLTVNMDTYGIGANYADIEAAVNADKCVILRVNGNFWPMIGAYDKSGAFEVDFMDWSDGPDGLAFSLIQTLADAETDELIVQQK